MKRLSAMSTKEFILIVGCAVVGFLLVSALVEAFGSKDAASPESGSRSETPTRIQKRAGIALIVILVFGLGYLYFDGSIWNVLSEAPQHPSTPYPLIAEIKRSRNGHFEVIGQVNGSSIPLVVDTGASALVLTQDAAEMAEVNLGSLTYSVEIQTANGPARAAPILIDRVTVGGITQRAVDALVVRRGASDTSLLGMSFLNRLDGWEVRGDRLIMHGRPN